MIRVYQFFQKVYFYSICSFSNTSSFLYTIFIQLFITFREENNKPPPKNLFNMPLGCINFFKNSIFIVFAHFLIPHHSYALFYSTVHNIKRKNNKPPPRNLFYTPLGCINSFKKSIFRVFAQFQIPHHF